MKRWLLISRECVDSVRRGGIASANFNHIEMLNKNGISVVELVAKEPMVHDKIFNDGHSRVSLCLRDYSLSNRFISKVFRRLLYIPYRLNIMFYVLKNYKKFNVIEVADYGAEGIFLIFFPFIRNKLLVRGHCISSFDILSHKIRFFSTQYIFEIVQLLMSKNIFSCSHALASLYKKLLLVESKVIYNPVQSDVKKEIVYNSNRNGILFLGTLSKFKGTDVVLEMSRKYKRKVTLAGRRSSSIDIKNYTSNLKYHGLVNKDMVNKLLKEHKVLVVSSRWESLPMVIIEAMNHGILVVGANNSGISELISDGKTGFLYNTENFEDLELTLQKVDKLSIDDYKAIVTNAKTYINKKTSYEAIYKSWSKFLLG